MIEIKNLQKGYDDKKGILKNVSLDIPDGTIFGLVGADGSGKSTLLHICAGLDRPNSGIVLVRGTEITKLSADALAEYRGRHMGIVFQNHNLIPQFTALENILIPTVMVNKDKIMYEENLKKIIASLGIADRLHHLPSELSGGQQQRVAIARALINMPIVLFADEPTGNLDKENADEVLELLIKTQKLLGQTLVMVTHDMSIAAKADRVFKMDNGELTVVNKEKLKRSLEQ
jgi:lipoprotein-releasing system ATP-binding protein